MKIQFSISVQSESYVKVKKKVDEREKSFPFDLKRSWLKFFFLEDDLTFPVISEFDKA